MDQVLSIVISWRITSSEYNDCGLYITIVRQSTLKYMLKKTGKFSIKLLCLRNLTYGESIVMSLFQKLERIFLNAV